MFNWDLYILDPFFILLGIFFIGLFFRREKESKSHLFFYFETLLIWIVNTVLLHQLTLNLGFGFNFSSTVTIILAFFASSSLLTVCLKPLATWLTGIIQSRRPWMWAGIITSLGALILGQCYANQAEPVIVLVVLALLVAFSISSQSLYYLYANEQFYYRSYPVFTSIKIGTIIALATFIGAYLLALNSSVQGYLFEEPDANIHYLYGFCYAFLLLSFIFSLLKRENSAYVQSFDSAQLTKLQPYRKRILVYLMLLAFLWGVMYGLTQSKIQDFFFISNLKYNGHENQEILSFFALYKDFYFLPTFIFGYWFYHYFYKKVDTFQMTIGLSLGLALTLVVAAFTRHWVVILLANFIFGLIFSQIFFLIFGFAMMWNYRVHKIPVTGLVAASAVGGTFIIEMLMTILQSLNIGVFGYFKNVHEVINATDLSEFLWMINGAVSLAFAGGFVATVCFILALIFTFKPIAAEFTNLSSSINQLEDLDRQIFIDRLKSKLKI